MGKIGFLAVISLIALIPLILAANDPQQQQQQQKQQVYASKPCSPGRDREDCSSDQSFMACTRQTQNAPYGCTCMRIQPTNSFNWSHPYFNHNQRKCVLPVGEHCEFTKPEPKILCEPNSVCIQLKDDEKMKDYGICSGAMKKDGSLVMGFIFVTAIMANFFNTK